MAKTLTPSFQVADLAHKYWQCMKFIETSISDSYIFRTRSGRLLKVSYVKSDTYTGMGIDSDYDGVTVREVKPD